MKKTWVDEAGCSLVTDATTDAHKAALRIINSGRLSGGSVTQSLHDAPLQAKQLLVTLKSWGLQP